MDAPDRYFSLVITLLARLRESQRAAVAAAAEAIAASLAADGIVHLFGTGHSHMLAEEVFYRAGGLLPVQAMLDPAVVLSGGARRSTMTERTPGAAAKIAERYDLRARDAGIVISNSGRNPAPIEMAQLMKARAMRVIAITSVAHSSVLRRYRSTACRIRRDRHRRLPGRRSCTLSSSVPWNAWLPEADRW
jgi:uncharacterized phosphosugar-binding protein